MEHRVGIALGSNLGDRLAYLCEARDLLRDLATPDALYLQAPVYQSAPVDCSEDAPAFFNTVIEIAYEGEPHALLESTQQIERTLGRHKAKGEHNAPRVIDVDILYFCNRMVHEEKLTIPHPRLIQRLFVLQPLCDIRPELVLPEEALTIAKHLKQLETDEPPLKLVQTTW